MKREELLATARKHMWAAWQLSSEELASQAADTLIGLGMLVPEGGSQELERLRLQVVELQETTAEAGRDAVRARRERDLMRERVSEPNGCAHCGVAKRSHGRQYVGGVGMHAWERPSDEQVKARMLARRVARSPLPATPELDQVLEDLTGANLARWEEEQDNARLRLALASAKRGRSKLRARVAELEAERHTTNQALADMTVAQRAEESADKLTALLAPSDEREAARRSVDRAFPAVAEFLADGVTRLNVPLQALREDSHDGPLHHSYRVPRDLPETGGAR